MMKTLLKLTFLLVVLINGIVIFYLEDPNQLPIANGLQMAVFRMCYQYNDLLKTVANSHMVILYSLIVLMLLPSFFIKNYVQIVISLLFVITFISLQFISNLHFPYIYAFIIFTEFLIYLVASLIMTLFYRRTI